MKKIHTKLAVIFMLLAGIVGFFASALFRVDEIAGELIISSILIVGIAYIIYMLENIQNKDDDE